MKKITILFITLLTLCSTLWAEVPDRPNPQRLVNDFAGIFSSSEQQEMESKLEQFARTTSTQIVVVTVSSLDGYDRADYAFQIGEKWGVGQKDKNNGLVVLLKPKTTDSRGQVFIATGYGLEGVLPDATINSTVVNNEMIPRFKQNDYYGGVTAGLNVIMDITKGEYTAEEYEEQVASSGGGSALIPILFLILFFFIVSKSRKNRFYSAGKGLPFWLAMTMLSGNNRSSGSFGDFSSGGGSFGGGGFGGFGGGSFGGGGAGGSW
jgi:uncharacterized protein